MVKIDTSLMLPKSHPYRPRRKLAKNPPYVTIHNTGSMDADAKAIAKYLYNVPKKPKSWHFSIDDTICYQSIPIGEEAWHAGTRAGNSQSVGIEVSMYRDKARHAKYEDNGAQLAAGLLFNWKVRSADVPKYMKKHQEWSGKYCPSTIIPHWPDFVARVQNHVKVLEGTPPVEGGEEEVAPSRVAWYKAHSNMDDVEFVNKLTALCKEEGKRLDEIPIAPEYSHLERRLA